MVWIYINDFKEISSEVSAIHVDTRDFYLVTSVEDVFENKELKQLLEDLQKREDYQDFLIDQNEIKTFIKDIERMTGGYGDWRCISFDVNKTPEDLYPKGRYSGWFKYIRFYRVSGTNNFVVTYDIDSKNFVKAKKLFVKEYIDEESLGMY